MSQQAVWSFLASLAACPDCPAVHEARVLVFSASFWHNAVSVVAPLALVAIAVQRFFRHLDRADQDKDFDVRE